MEKDLPQVREVLTWQDLLNILTLKGNDTGVLQKVKGANEGVKFTVCYNANKVYLKEWLLDKNLNVNKKSIHKSEDHRLSGNKAYQKGDDVAALKLYNHSLVTAPQDTNQFALALSNRSAALFRLQHFQEALSDIEIALQHSTPVPRSKLLIRKALILYKLCVFEDVVHIIKTLFPSEEDICNQQNVEIKNAYFGALLECKNSTKSDVSQKVDEIPSPKGGVNKIFSSASEHILLNYSKDKGRYVTAQDDLNTHDIIFVEKPFALVVLPDQYEHHCHHCCREFICFIPCHECTRAKFCSESCRQEAWGQYHQWECSGLEVCHSIGIAHLGFRVALMASDTQTYQQVHDLVTHIDDMTKEDLYQYALTAALLVVYLENCTSYFKTNPSVSREQMGSRILRHVAQLVCNGHAIIKINNTILEKGCHKTATEVQVRIATAIYPSASMMNHSCDQNISNSFINKHLIVRVSRPIKKGEEILNCYGPNYRTMRRDERQKLLQNQYMFKCECSKCSEGGEWEAQFDALRCELCSGPVLTGQAECAHCHGTQPLHQLVQMALTAQQSFYQGQCLLNDGSLNEALKLLEDTVNLSSKCLYKQNTDLRTYKDSLARLYAELGRYSESISLIEECVRSIEEQFGSSSDELSRELLKLLDVLKLDLARLEETGLQCSDEYRACYDHTKRIQKRIATHVMDVDATIHLNKITTNNLKSKIS